MCYLHNPASWFVARYPFLLIDLFAAASHLGYVPSGDNRFLSRLTVIALVSTQVLPASAFGFCDFGIQYRRQLSHIVAICSGYEYRQRDAMAFDEEMPLAAVFSPGQLGCAQPLAWRAGP